MPAPGNKAVVQVVFDGFNARDFDRVAAVCADDFVLESLPAGLTLFHPSSSCRSSRVPPPDRSNQCKGGSSSTGNGYRCANPLRRPNRQSESNRSRLGARSRLQEIMVHDIRVDERRLAL
jgi:hypothetical protein